MTSALSKFKEINLKNEILSGLTVAIALVPEAVAFAFVAGVPPLVGLYAAFMIGLITSVFGGRPGMISGATGALAVVMVSLVANHGIEYLFITVVLMGILQVLFGFLKLGKFIKIVPLPVVFGFVNGLAIVIFLAQFNQFKVPSASGGSLEWIQGNQLYLMLGLVGLTMGIMHFLPKLTKAVPSALAGIVIVSILAIGFKLDTKTVGDLAIIKGGLPSFHFPQVPFTFDTLKIIFPYALILAGIGLIESLLTLTLLDDITETKGKSNKECLAQGAANICTGFFGGMGGCAMIGQSLINVNSGGRTRIAGIAASLFLLCFILFTSDLIQMIPIAALVGVMFMVVIGTFEWSSLRILHKIPKADALVIVSVSVLTIVFDLAIAVIIGVIMSALVFSWDNAIRIRVKKYTDKNDIKHYEISGPLFFGSALLFQENFTPRTDPQEVMIDFKNSRVVDHSGLEVLQKLTDRYTKLNKRVSIQNLSPDCVKLLGNAGSMIKLNFHEIHTAYAFSNDSTSK